MFLPNSCVAKKPLAWTNKIASCEDGWPGQPSAAAPMFVSQLRALGYVSWWWPAAGQRLVPFGGRHLHSWLVAYSLNHIKCQRKSYKLEYRQQAGTTPKESYICWFQNHWYNYSLATHTYSLLVTIKATYFCALLVLNFKLRWRDLSHQLFDTETELFSTQHCVKTVKWHFGGISP